MFDQGNEIGESWRKRYDSLKLFKACYFSTLSSLSLGGDPNGYTTKDEISDYLLHYAKEFPLLVKIRTVVQDWIKQGIVLFCTPGRGEYRSKQVIVAIGPFQKPNILEFSKFLSNEVLPLHSSEYECPFQLLL
ncbi:hypothetical protein A361_27380 (plasmid) [Cytobacillus oceanisediminis 2691]|jgi:putative flavoprotein involved in K+ transport|uniref:Uncharacterized protein n=2 Tax=Bacillales TaxID=1385 RepID=A0A161IZ74_9BACI|nr:hypothetical protein A361_27380 [Cytobacillus oceanisediminis 2691]MBN8202703.1 NAD(P)-binding domain-containing protein [Bacillus sp. NTK034]MCM3244728.1 NAD(P)-binding domain-containing protein [Cytobacillus oceanisediminis]